jgi:hypothetical protein
MSRQFLFALFAVMTVSLAYADPRTDVQGVAKVVEERFFDAQRATDIANDLRRRAAAGEFDKLTDRRDLANELTRLLGANDGHLRVQYSPQQARTTAVSASGEALPESRTNHGFRRVERLPGNIAYIEIAYFADIDFADAKSPARATADAALALGRDADAFIVDLRSNGGGGPSMVGYVVSAFVDPKAQIYNTFHSREGTETEMPAVKYPTPMLSIPLYVLTSGRTGSAAESFAFTLQAAKRAQIVGERSAGAANPGEMFHTPQGYGVFVATGSPRNPINQRNWEREGVKPDVDITAARALVRAQELALERVLAGSIAGGARRDAQWALDALRAPAPTQKLAADVSGEFGPYTLETRGGIVLAKRARWPAMTLLPLAADLFYFEGEPSRRLAVERADGKLVAVTFLNSDGRQQRFHPNDAGH